MNKTDVAYIQLLSNAINQTSVKIDLADIDAERLVNLSDNNGNIAMVYTSCANEKSTPKELLEVLQKGFFSEVMRCSKRTAVYNLIVKKLNENKIILWK